MVHPHDSGSTLRIFKILYTGKGQELDESNITGFYQKKFSWKMVILGPKMGHPHNSGSALRLFFKFCTMKEADKYMKILSVVFFRKNFISGNLIFFGHFLLFDWTWSKLS